MTDLDNNSCVFPFHDVSHVHRKTSVLEEAGVDKENVQMGKCTERKQCSNVIRALDPEDRVLCHAR